ncbi:HGGxSTG domain-containing protein [Halobacterium salinarum]|uniref:HGGxSTG domain-containing protein n=1 Tax=Halobacterium salinarum TaxID=2242 RepID=UPI0030CF90AD
MSSEKTADTGRRYSDICGATNNRGEPCKLPKGWGTPGSGGGRCKFHGGCSTGPSDTEYLKENDFAEGNSGGKPPKGNTNGEIHGGFADWQKAYERFDGETQAWVDRMVAEMRETAKEHAPTVDVGRREQLLKEKATLSILHRRASADTIGSPADPIEGARGFVIEEQREHAGETYTVRKVNPALEATLQHSKRKREIAKELSLWPGFQDHGESSYRRGL